MFCLNVPCLISVVAEIKSMSLFIGMDVQRGQRADHLLERQECRRNGLCLIVDELFTRNSSDLKNVINHFLNQFKIIFYSRRIQSIIMFCLRTQKDIKEPDKLLNKARSNISISVRK